MNLRKYRHFAESESGSQSIEAVFAFPIVIVAMVSVLVFFDGFKTKNVAQRATYTVADMMSREKGTVDDDYLAAMHELYGFLSDEKSGYGLRVTVVSMSEDPITNVKTMELEWSEGVGGPVGYEDLEQIEKRVPIMASGDQMILVEAYQTWFPLFDVGLKPMTFREVAVARPRFAPQLVWGDNA